MKDIKIPFCNGKMLGYPDEFYQGFEWVDNYVFEATLKIDSYGRGRSSVKINVSDENGKEYEMFISDFIDAIQKAKIENGCFSGKFTFCKKGQNYGLKMEME